MATEQSFVDYVTEVAALGSRLTHKKMFGEYALYLDGKVVAFACDNSLYLKPSKAAAALAPELPQGPPYPGAKEHPIADQLLDDPDALRRLIEATAALMPPPKPKKPPAARRGAAFPAGAAAPRLQLPGPASAREPHSPKIEKALCSSFALARACPLGSRIAQT